MAIPHNTNNSNSGWLIDPRVTYRLQVAQGVVHGFPILKLFQDVQFDHLQIAKLLSLLENTATPSHPNMPQILYY